MCREVWKCIYQNTSSHIHTHTRTRGSRQTVTVCGGNQKKVMFVFASDFTVQYSTQWSRSAPASLRIRTPGNLYRHGARCGSSLECNLFMLCLKTLKVLEAIYRISLYKKDVIRKLPVKNKKGTQANRLDRNKKAILLPTPAPTSKGWISCWWKTSLHLTPALPQKVGFRVDKKQAYLLPLPISKGWILCW